MNIPETKPHDIQSAGVILGISNVDDKKIIENARKRSDHLEEL